MPTRNQAAMDDGSTKNLDYSQVKKSKPALVHLNMDSEKTIQLDEPRETDGTPRFKAKR